MDIKKKAKRFHEQISKCETSGLLACVTNFIDSLIEEINSDEEKRVLSCVKKWLEVKAKNQKGIDPECYNLLQIIPDIDHSYLLERLLKGEESQLIAPDWRVT